MSEKTKKEDLVPPFREQRSKKSAQQQQKSWERKTPKGNEEPLTDCTHCTAYSLS